MRDEDNMPERIWAGDFNASGFGHCVVGPQGGLYAEYVRADLAAPAGVPMAWCQPMHNGEHASRQFIVRFEDADRGDAVFDDEAEARAYWQKANDNWNCYLFGALPLHPTRTPVSAPVGMVEIHIVFQDDGGAANLRFVEVETLDRKSVSVGTWMKRDDGYDVLALSVHPSDIWRAK